MKKPEVQSIVPCGILYAGGQAYYLLSPHPITRVESWERDDCYRFSVVPYAADTKNQDGYVYSYARHLVTNAFAVEYRANMPAIDVLQLPAEYELEIP